jgi:hypothetical protein
LKIWQAVSIKLGGDGNQCRAIPKKTSAKLTLQAIRHPELVEGSDTCGRSDETEIWKQSLLRSVTPQVLLEVCLILRQAQDDGPFLACLLGGETDHVWGLEEVIALLD